MQRCLKHISAIGLPQVDMTNVEAECIMTHDELKSELFNIVDHFNMMIESRELLNIATDYAEIFSEQNFDRMNLLLEIYNSRTEACIHELTVSLRRVTHALSVDNQPVDIHF